ncbi:MAG: hypothetical protein SOU08_01695 [Anaerococcus sp.]|nr:hypothetical protein [Anaerococcus sp.]MDD7044863.1 hypothetical protein [Peptoniphilaceae bacterium]MDY2918340.1 hypothetical protein [Anaerococcus sp.]
MIKNLLLAAILILLSSCGVNTGQEANPNTNLTYPLAKLGLSVDTSLDRSSQGLDFPTEIMSKNDEAYRESELANLDYGRLIELSGLNIRIPSRCQVFSDRDNYYIDFPYSDSYSIYICLRDVKDMEILQESDINDATKILLNKRNPEEKLLSGVVNNKLSNVESAYFVSQGDKYQMTHFLIGTPGSMIHFTIYEDPSLSQASPYLMEDILMGTFRIDDDPIDIQKSFASFDDYMDIFATKSIRVGDITCKIPQNFLLDNSTENVNSFSVKKEGDMISKIIAINFDKEDMDIEDLDIMDIFNLDYRGLVYSENIVSGSKLEFDKKDGLSYVRSKARMYMPNFTLDGDKFVVESKDYFITFFVIGPMAESNKTNLMSNSIIQSIEQN